MVCQSSSNVESRAGVDGQTPRCSLDVILLDRPLQMLARHRCRDLGMITPRVARGIEYGAAGVAQMGTQCVTVLLKRWAQHHSTLRLLMLLLCCTDGRPPLCGAAGGRGARSGRLRRGVAGGGNEQRGQGAGVQQAGAQGQSRRFQAHYPQDAADARRLPATLHQQPLHRAQPRCGPLRNGKLEDFDPVAPLRLLYQQGAR